MKLYIKLDENLVKSVKNVKGGDTISLVEKGKRILKEFLICYVYSFPKKALVDGYKDKQF